MASSSVTQRMACGHAHTCRDRNNLMGSGVLTVLALAMACTPLESTTGGPLSESEGDDDERPRVPGDPVSTSSSTSETGEGGDGDGDGDGDPCVGDAPEGVCLFEWSTVSAGGVPTGLAVGALGAGDRLDIVSAMFTGSGLAAWRLDDTGVLTEIPLPVAGGGYRGVTASDVDGDGFDDIVAVHPGLQVLTVYRNDGAGIFSLWSTATVVGNPRAVWTADMDGDDGVELVVLLESKGLWLRNLRRARCRSSENGQILERFMMAWSST